MLMDKKAALYIRVSTESQKEASSIPAQKEMLLSYAQNILEIDRYEYFVDAGFTGTNTNRPKFHEMIEHCKRKEFTHVIVAKIDRISRNIVDFSKLYAIFSKYDVTFISLREAFDTSTPIGQALLKVILSFAEYEIDGTKKRVMTVMKNRVKEGKWNGIPVSYGYRWDPETEMPVLVQEEAAVVRMIYEEFLSAGNLNQVARNLNDSGIPSQKGKTWLQTTLRHMLTNPCYKGAYVWNKYRYDKENKRHLNLPEEWSIKEDMLPPIVSKEVWDAAQEKLASRQVEKKTDYIHIFKDLLYCANCETKMHSKSQGKKSAVIDMYYCPPGKHTEGIRTTTTDKKLIRFLIPYIRNLLRIQEERPVFFSSAALEKDLLKGIRDANQIEITNKDELLRFFRAVARFDKVAYPEKQNILPFVSAVDQAKMNDLLNRLEDLKKQYLFGDLTVSDYRTQKQFLTAQVNRLFFRKKKTEGQLLETRNFDLSTFILLKVLKEETFTMPNRVGEVLTAAGKDTFRDFFRSIIYRIYIDGKEIREITFVNGVTHRFSKKSPTGEK